jgi:threonine aldolase
MGGGVESSSRGSRVASVLGYGHDVAKEDLPTYTLPPWVSYSDWLQHQQAALCREADSEGHGRQEEEPQQQAPPAAEWDSYLTGKFLQGFEGEVADKMGKASGCFVVTGTMAQLCAIQTHHEQQQHHQHPMRSSTDRDATVEGENEKVIMVHPTSHLLNHEADAFARLCGFTAVQVGDPNTALSAAAVRIGLEQLVAEGRSLPSTLLVEVPQRHNGGRCASFAELVEMRALCEQYGVKLHMDGARFWEARPAFGESYSTVAALFDSVYLSFYKGIGAAVGAMLCGEEDFVTAAKVWRHRFGGQLVHSTMITYDMATSMRAAEEANVHEKGYRQLVALADAVRTLVPRRLRFEPMVPESGLTHVHVRGDLPVLTAAATALEKRTGVSLVRGLNSKYDTGGGYSGDANKGNVRVGHELMGEDEFFFEWKVPKAWLDLPTGTLVEAYSEAWLEYFAIVDSMIVRTDTTAAAGGTPPSAVSARL